MAIRTLTIALDIEDGPYDVDDTVAELGASLVNHISDNWGEVDDSISCNAIREVSVVRTIDDRTERL